MDLIIHSARIYSDSSEAPVELESTRLNRFRSLFTRNLSINNNSIPSNDIDISERRFSSIEPTGSSLESRELPPPYSEERFTSPPVATIDAAEQTSSDDDDKMLVP